MDTHIELDLVGFILHIWLVHLYGRVILLNFWQVVVVQSSEWLREFSSAYLHLNCGGWVGFAFDIRNSIVWVCFSIYAVASSLGMEPTTDPDIPRRLIVSIIIPPLLHMPSWQVIGVMLSLQGNVFLHLLLYEFLKTLLNFWVSCCIISYHCVFQSHTSGYLYTYAVCFAVWPYHLKPWATNSGNSV